jgi:hypothetical protein
VLPAVPLMVLTVLLNPGEIPELILSETGWLALAGK